uniref:Uncharacterized protein n=1 Tax=Amphimedon queenslandica TaxID=400682 RepID=A0A1X7UG70_AMPQE
MDTIEDNDIDNQGSYFNRSPIEPPARNPTPPPASPPVATPLAPIIRRSSRNRRPVDRYAPEMESHSESADPLALPAPTEHRDSGERRLPPRIPPPALQTMGDLIGPQGEMQRRSVEVVLEAPGRERTSIEGRKVKQNKARHRNTRQSKNCYKVPHGPPLVPKDVSIFWFVKTNRI